MSAFSKPTLHLAGPSFLDGVVLSFTGPVMQLATEAFGRGTTNLALPAVGFALVDNGAGHGGG